MPSPFPLIETIQQAGYDPVVEVPLPGLDACHVDLATDFSPLVLLRDASALIDHRAPVLLGELTDLPDWLEHLRAPRPRFASDEELDALASSLYMRERDVSEVIASDRPLPTAAPAPHAQKPKNTSAPENLQNLIAASCQLPTAHSLLAISPTHRPEDLLLELAFGDFNDSPPADLHVAILRYWRMLWGAELIACTPGSLTLITRRTASSWADAFALATEHIAYCPQLTLDTPAAIKARATLVKTTNLWHFDWTTPAPPSPYLF